MSIALHRVYLTSSTSGLSKLEETRLSRDQVIELFINNPLILDFLAEKIYTYERLVSMEYYKYIQIIAIPDGKRINMYPLIFDFYGVDLSDTTFYPTIFTGIDRVIEHLDWMRRSKAEHLKHYREWLSRMKTGIKLIILVKNIVFVFNDVTPELVTYLDSINIVRKESKINLLIVKKYRCEEGFELVNITYIPWS